MDEDQVKKQKLQCLIVVDSFSNKFKPLCCEMISSLFPVANIPIIHYIMEFLIMNQVEEIFIATMQMKSSLERTLKQYKYKGVSIQVIQLEDASNFGDVLREINQHQIIQSDFILLKGDIITNSDIQGALQFHQKNKLENKDRKLLVTKLFKRIQYDNPKRHEQQELTLILDKDTKEILKYDSELEQNSKDIKINEEYIKLKQSQKYLDIVHDLVDTDISICSPDILNYFSDNFDCENMHDEFVNSINSSEIMDDRIMAYEIPQKYYFGQIIDPRIYSVITQNIISRYNYPFVLDSKLLAPNNNYTYTSFNRYIDQGVQIQINSLRKYSSNKLLSSQNEQSPQQVLIMNKNQSIQSLTDKKQNSFNQLSFDNVQQIGFFDQYNTINISDNCVLGQDCKIGINTIIEKSTLGKNCKIGKNVIIINSYIWDDVEIQDYCQIYDALICSNVLIKKSSVLQSGSIIAFKVKIKQNVTLPQGTIASLYSYDSKEKKFKKPQYTTEEYLEQGVISYLPRDLLLKKEEMVGQQSVYMTKLYEESDLDEDEDELDDVEEKFNREVKETIERCLKSQHPIDNTLVEVRSLKMSENMSYSMCIEAIIPPILDICGNKQLNSVQERVQEIKKILDEWGYFIKEFAHEEEDFYTILRSSVIYCSNKQEMKPAFHLVIQKLYQLQILKKEYILKWNEQIIEAMKLLELKKNNPDIEVDDIFEKVSHEQMQKFISSLDKFIQWLKQKDDSEDEDEEEEEESEKESNEESDDNQ